MTSCARARRSSRGFTIVEMVVVLALIGLLLAFALPRVVGSATFAEDQKAQTTASGALDTAVSVFLSSGAGDNPSTVRDGNGCNAAVSNPRQQLDGPPYTTAATNCPVFANAHTYVDVNDVDGDGNRTEKRTDGVLPAATGDVKFVEGDEPSPDSSTASIAAEMCKWSSGTATSPATCDSNLSDPSSGDGWRIAVAVLSPRGGTGNQTLSSCWMAWHEFPTGNSVGASRERYFSTTNDADADVSTCTGNLALTKDTATGGSVDSCDTPAGGGPAQGTSWRRPCSDYGTVVKPG